MNRRERTIEDVRRAVDTNISGKIDPSELPMALQMIREIEDMKASEKRELRMKVIKESFKEGGIGTVAVVIGVTMAGILLSFFSEFGILFL